MKRSGTRPLRARWKLLGLAIVAWVSYQCAAAIARGQSTVSFPIDPELQGRYHEHTDPELGTGLFI